MNAFATKTRLMGVVAGYVDYVFDDTRYVEFYHIEFEEYGVDRFDQLLNPSAYDIQQLKLEVCGGLGGPLVPIDPAAFRQLILAGRGIDAASEAYAQAAAASRWLAAPHAPAFDPQLFAQATEAVCEELRSPYEFIHYFLMRYVGQDTIYLRFAPFLSQQSLDQAASSKPTSSNPSTSNRSATQVSSTNNLAIKRATLMRSQVERLELEENTYRFSALLLDSDYHVLEGQVVLEEGIVDSFNIDVYEPVTDLEAALMLKKHEHIYLYDIDDSTGHFEGHLIGEHKYLTVTLYTNGRLYTCYRSHNDHVNQKVFYLNGDVEAYIYITDSNQLLLVADDLKAMLKWDDILTSRFGNDLDKYEEWDFESPILYDFIDSDFVDFDDFLANTPFG